MRLPSATHPAATFAQSINATLAVDRKRLSTETPYSLSPASLTAIPAETSLVLPSPNGSAISALAAQLGRPMLAGCLRNAAAVAAAAKQSGSSPRASDGGATAAYGRPMRTLWVPERSSTRCPHADGRPKRRSAGGCQRVRSARDHLEDCLMYCVGT